MRAITKTILLLLGLAGFIITLSGLEYTPNQILFKTTNSLELQRGRTGLTEFDRFLDDVQALSVQPVKGLHGNRWFSATVLNQPDWQAIKSNNISFSGIDIIQPNYLNKFHITPNDPWYSLQQMNLVSLPQAWNYTTGSSMIVVGVVDSGLLTNHPDLINNIFHNLSEIPDNGIDDDNNGYIDDHCGWDFADAPEMNDEALGDFIDQDNDVSDENYHGTHVAGILGAVANNGIGIAGVCWNVKILPMRAGFRTTSGTGFLQDDDAAAAIIYGADMGCSVMNLSWGDANYSPIIADACNYAFERGITLVASAGNDPGPYLSYPAKLASVISVGAVDPYRNLAGFSSYGQELDLVAPGQEIYSTYKDTGNELYEQMSGTSMSSPFVAGAVALLKSIQPNLSPDEVRSRLLSSTDDLGYEGFDIYFGHGLLNVRKLLENTSAPYVNVSYPADNIGVSADFDILGTVNSATFFRYSVMCALQGENATLVWKDVYSNTTTPQFHYTPVVDGVIAHFKIHDLMQEGTYVIRIQYEDRDGSIYNLFRSINLDQTQPIMRPGTFSVMKRYDGQNVRFYAGALFNEQVRAELTVFDSQSGQYSIYPSKLDSVQVWMLPVTLPAGNISVRIRATNNSNLTFQSQIIPNVFNIQYEIVPNYGYTSREVGAPMVTLNRFHDFDQNGINEFIAMDLPTTGYGIDRIFEPSDSDYAVKYTYANRFMPLDMGNSNTSGQEILGLNLDTVTLYETLQSNQYPITPIWSETGISGGIFADYDNDGNKEIMLIKNLATERVINLHKRLGPIEVSTPKITLRNTTTTNLRNMFVPTIICTNLDNDVRPDILTADTDGDIMIFEVTSSTSATMTWSFRLSVANTYYLTSGDYDGNGVNDFVVGGYHTDVLDPNQNFWFFEGFTRTSDNNYHSMGYFQFNQVNSQNAIQSFDLDNDGKQEIIMSLSPNLYVVKYIDGKFQPIFWNNSSRTYQIAVWNQNNQPHFLTNAFSEPDSLRSFVWTKQTPFTGPPTPANLVAIPQDANHISLNWQETGASYYCLYRKDTDNPAVKLADVYATSYQDSAVVEGTTYHYSISAVDFSYSPEESILSQWLAVTPMVKPVVTDITMISSNEVRITFNQQLATSALNPGCYSIDHDMGNPLSVNSVLNKYGVQLRFRNLFPAVADSFRLDLTNIYGITGVAPEQTVYYFHYNQDYTAPYIQSAEVRSDNRSVDIYLSESILPDGALNTSNYELVLPSNDSDNRIQSVSLNDDVITVVLRYQIKYTNQLYYMILRNITDLAGNPIIANQNICKFYRSDITNLSSLVAYPNPVKVSQYNQVNFMNFPPGIKGKLAIYNISGDLIFESAIGPFNPATSNISCQWNLRNSSGKRVSSGVYYFIILMGNETRKGKIAVLN
jgi:hypothetical protein